MPRGEFNTTCDVFHGPGTATPGELKGTCDCRLVPQAGIDLDGVGAPWIAAWVTMEEVRPRGGWTDYIAGWKADLGDTIAVPSGTTPTFYCVYAERITWGEQATYYRACVALLPRPQSCRCATPGGEECEEAQEVAPEILVVWEVLTAPWNRWFACDVTPETTYRYLCEGGTGVECFIQYGECGELTGLASGQDDWQEFYVPAGVDRILIVISSSSEVPIEGTFLLLEGPIP